MQTTMTLATLFTSTSTSISLRAKGSISPVIMGLLEKSVLEKGLQNPIVLDEQGNVIDGYKRCLVLQKLHSDNRLSPDYEVPVVFSLQTRGAASNVALQLELDRTTEKLNSFDKSRAIALVGEKALQDATGYTDSTIRVLSGLQKQLSQNVKSLVESGMLTTTHAIQLKSLNHNDQDLLAEQAIQQKMSIRDLKAAVENHKKGMSNQDVTRENAKREELLSSLCKLLSCDGAKSSFVGSKLTLQGVDIARLEALLTLASAMPEEKEESDANNVPVLAC